ncbi:MAG: tetraacyldisaccharide 4'-kinase [Candidatus Zixiibacteriota bacterium]
MSKFWEVIINSRGKDRFYCFPFLFLFRIIAPVYQLFSRQNLEKRKMRCSREWKARVISIGNITVGGSGKTPIIVRLARGFLAAGKKIAIVHSGYGRESKDDFIIPANSSETFTPKQIGDETAMMRLMLPSVGFAVGRNKKAMVIAADRELAPDIILIDDGFQRLDIEKDVDIAIVSSELFPECDDKAGRKKLRLFPAGILREQISALERAHVIFSVTDSEQLASNLIAYSIDKPVFDWQMRFAGIYRGDKKIADETIRQLKPLVFAGIGSFGRMLEMIEQEGIPVKRSHNFGDHYRYDTLDFEHLKYMREEAKADCYLTTAKDLVKLPPIGLDAPLYCLAFDATPLDENIFSRLMAG